MSGIILPVPEATLRYALGRTAPKVEIDADASGLTQYQGWAAPNLDTSQVGWVITKYVYAGSNPNVPSKYSTLSGVIWDLRTLYVFP